MIYPPMQEFTIRFLDTVLFLLILAGHVKLLLDGRRKQGRTILIDGKPVVFEQSKKEKK